MSDYKHNKVVRLPFPKEILEKCNTSDAYECELYLRELLGELWDNNDKNSFKLDCSDKRAYIDWVYYSTYGEESGDWGNARLLTQKELDTIKPFFNKIGIPYGDTDLRVVDFCYYNACEPPDYYDIVNEDTDHSGLFIN